MLNTALTSVLFLPYPNHEKSIRQIPVEEQPKKYLLSTPQSFQDHHKQGKSEKMSQPSVIWDAGTEKGKTHTQNKNTKEI